MRWKEPLNTWLPLSRGLYAFHAGGSKLPDARHWRPFSFGRFAMARGEVWESMLENFTRAVMNGEVVLYGRPMTALSDFEQVPRDVWFQIESIDWLHGIATAFDGSRYYSIHVGPPEPVDVVTPSPPKKEGWGKKTQRVTAAMRRVPPQELMAFGTKELEGRFGASRTLCMEVRKKVFAEGEAAEKKARTKPDTFPK